MTKLNNRIKVFQDISAQLAGKEFFSNEKSVIVNGDSRDILSYIPNQSISLILTDPPYHSTKKDNIINDRAFKKDEDFLEWIEVYAK
ncbi:MAG: hypothetical protein IKV37_06665, partial [Prevotella sp.]|nr:hypothetical protein [Prevotella sp.]